MLCHSSWWLFYSGTEFLTKSCCLVLHQYISICNKHRNDRRYLRCSHKWNAHFGGGEQGLLLLILITAYQFMFDWFIESSCEIVVVGFSGQILWKNVIHLTICRKWILLIFSFLISWGSTVPSNYLEAVLKLTVQNLYTIFKCQNMVHRISQVKTSIAFTSFKMFVCC